MLLLIGSYCSPISSSNTWKNLVLSSFNDLHIYVFIINPHNDVLPVSLIAELMEHCTGIAEARVRIPVQA